MLNMNFSHYVDSNVKSNIINFVFKNFLFLSVIFVKSKNYFGLMLVLLILLQCLTGVIVGMSLVVEPMIIPMSREEEDTDDLYVDDFFFLHERGVDFIFIFLFLHFINKYFMCNFSVNSESAWKSGSFVFLLIHITIFFGLVLCTTHLSDITLTIAANVINTLTFKYGKFYYFLFTDQSLNVDTMIRAAYIHYILGFVTLVFGILHAMLMHYDYKDFSFFNSEYKELNWIDVILKIELFNFFFIYFWFYIFSKFFYLPVEALSFEIFMWGDVGFITEIRFLGVAPHWYFRSYMGWLLLCPHHYLGIFGLIFFMVCIYFQPNLKKKIFSFSKNCLFIFSNSEFSYIHIFFFSIFLINLLYTNTFLPYGRFYNMVGGNDALMISYIYLYFHFIIPFYKLFK